MTANVFIGTASWTDKTLIACKRFYPRAVASAEARLRYYAEQFPLVEVDSSYYALPSEANARLWAERTPDGFVFNIKAFRLFTQHQTPLAALPREMADDLRALRKANVYASDIPRELLDSIWDRFLSALEPLRAAGKLGALHFQFPPWFMANRENYRYIQATRDRLGAYQLTVEFRHNSWFAGNQAEATLKFERDHRLVNTIVDEPQGFDSSVPMIWEPTLGELALVRLHGRNAQTWNAKGLAAASDRFNYDYSDSELTELSKGIVQLAQKVKRVDVIFNNNYEDQGPRNARSLQKILGGEQSSGAGTGFHLT